MKRPSGSDPEPAPPEAPRAANHCIAGPSEADGPLAKARAGKAGILISRRRTFPQWGEVGSSGRIGLGRRNMQSSSMSRGDRIGAKCAAGAGPRAKPENGDSPSFGVRADTTNGGETWAGEAGHGCAGRALPQRSAGVTLTYGTAPPAHSAPTLPLRALNSAVECHLHTVEVAGSNPAAPTISPYTTSTSRLNLRGFLRHFAAARRLTERPARRGSPSGWSLPLVTADTADGRGRG